MIHAAGIADGALLGRQTRDGMAQVFAAKTAGTRHLLECLAEEPLDFCLLCSALSATTGAPGQAAYTAANSYLEHVALAAPARWPVIAMGWDAWRDVGMAARHAATRLEMSGRGLNIRSCGHVAICRWSCSLSGPIARYRLVPAEHPAGEQALLPGTAYLELAAAAAERSVRYSAARDS